MTLSVSTAQQTEGWVSPEIDPPQPVGMVRDYIVAVRSGDDAKVRTYAATYLHRVPLIYDDCICGRGDECEDGCPTTGWFNIGLGGEYDYHYEALLRKGDELVAWRAIELHPLDHRAKATGAA